MAKKFKILAAGDLQGNPVTSEELAKKAERENVDLIILAGDIHGEKRVKNLIYPLVKTKKKIIFVPGNWDSTFESNTIRDMYGIDNIDGMHIKYAGINIIGIGSPDFQLNIDSKKNLDKLIENFMLTKKSGKKILVSHIHAKNTLAEFSGFSGSKIVRKAIDYFQPDIFISSHIHEAEGLEEKIGKTHVFQVGRLGKIIEIN